MDAVDEAGRILRRPGAAEDQEATVPVNRMRERLLPPDVLREIDDFEQGLGIVVATVQLRRRQVLAVGDLVPVLDGMNRETFDGVGLRGRSR